MISVQDIMHLLDDYDALTVEVLRLREALTTWRDEAEFWKMEAAMPLKLAFKEIVERIDSILSPEAQL